MKIKISQLCSFMTMIIFSNFLFLLNNKSFNNINSWIIPIVSTIIGIIIINIYLSIKNISFIKPFLFILSIIFSITIFNDLIKNIKTFYLYNTPIWFINIIVLIIGIYFITKKETVIFRTSLVIFYVFLFLYMLSYIGLINQININNLKPFFEKGISNLLISLFKYTLYSVIPLFMITSIENVEKNNYKKWIIATYIFSNFLVFISIFTSLSILGYDLFNFYKYPQYHTLKRVFNGLIIDRFENFLAIQYIIVQFISWIFFFYYSIKYIKK